MQFNEDKIYSTLGNRSKDDAGQGFIDSDQIVYDFDEITSEIALQYRDKRPMASCDALYLRKDDNIFLIEFKNVKKSRIGRTYFLQKAYDSVYSLQFAFFNNLSIEELRDRLCLVVVYNDGEKKDREQESKHFDEIKSSIKKLAGIEKRDILFDLEKYMGVLYNDVITVEKTEFMDEIYPQIFTA